MKTYEIRSRWTDTLFATVSARTPEVALKKFWKSCTAEFKEFMAITDFTAKN